jgi:hypothetical protein
MSKSATAARTKAEILSDAQRAVDRLATFDEYKAYVAQRKLSLIDSRLAVFDKMLESGELKTPRIGATRPVTVDNDLSLSFEDGLKRRSVRAAVKATATMPHDCMENAVPYKSDGALGHGWECGICGEFLQAG